MRIDETYFACTQLTHMRNNGGMKVTHILTYKSLLQCSWKKFKPEYHKITSGAEFKILLHEF